MNTLKAVTGKALLCFLIFTVITGLLYPAVVTGISKTLFPYQAGGSLFEAGGKTYSALLGQEYKEMDHMWGRIMNVDTGSMTDDEGNPLMYGWASNKTPAGEELESLIAERVERIREAHPDQAGEPIPVDLVTCSGSGLDPEISVAAAEYQIGRLAEHTGRSEEEIGEIIDRYTTGRFLGVFGEARVNVLKVNLALDGVLED